MAQNPLHPVFPSGTISGNANTVYSLLERLQTQLDPDSYGEAQQISVQADDANAAAIFIGKASPIAGEVSSTNYGVKLNPSGSQTWRSGAVQVSPVGTLRILSTSSWIAHVDVNG